MALRTAGDEDDVLVEEFEDFDLQVRGGGGEELVAWGRHRSAKQDATFAP